MTVFLFSSSILDRNKPASSTYSDLGITPVLLSSILASDASHQIAQETDARFGHGGRMCKRLLPTVAPLGGTKQVEQAWGGTASSKFPLKVFGVLGRILAFVFLKVLLFGRGSVGGGTAAPSHESKKRSRHLSKRRDSEIAASPKKAQKS